MSQYTLKLEVLRDEYNTIKADSNYFELNSRAKQIVDDIVALFQENSTVMQQLVTDIQNIAPDSTYYTKEAIDQRILNLKEMQNFIQLELLEQSKKNTQMNSFVKSITSKIVEQIESFESLVQKINKLDETVSTLSQRVDDSHFLTWQNTETLAEYIRQNDNTGIMRVKQHSAFPSEPFKQPIDTRYSPMDIHQHHNYDGMPGMGQYSFVANGYIGYTRHNDYKLEAQGATAFSKIKVEAPSVPNYNFTVENMQDLFARYMSGNLVEEEKELFQWNMSHLVCWWQEVDSLDGYIDDTFDSFRHTYGRSKPIVLAANFNEMRASAKKARFENVPFIPIASKGVGKDGKTVYSVFLYHIVTSHIPSLNGKKWEEFMDRKTDMVNDASFGEVSDTSVKAKFQFKTENVFDEAIKNIPSIGGLSEEITDYKTIDGHTVTAPSNVARFHRKYQITLDAVGRANYRNGFNDPTLIVGYTKHPKVVNSVSYMIPLEMILRTPLETWNPNNLEVKSTVTGTGTLTNPFNGIREDKYFYHTPSEFYDGYGNSDPADTGSGVKAVTNMDGEVTKNVGSGIYIVLPKIKGVEDRVRIRFPINWTSKEFSPANIMLSAYAKKSDEMLDFLKLNSITTKGVN